MPTTEFGNREPRGKFWRGLRYADHYMYLIFGIAAWLATRFCGGSGIIMASLTALVVCFSVAWGAYRGEYLDNWNPWSAWAIRVFAAITGWRLFTAAPTRLTTAIAVILYAVFYILSDYALTRRVRLQQSSSRDLAT